MASQTAIITFAEDLGTEVVDILVGPECKRYVVHKKPLTSQSEYFRNAFKGNFKEAQENSIHFEEDDPEAVALLIGWIYRGVIPGAERKISSFPYSKTSSFANSSHTISGQAPVPQAMSIDGSRAPFMGTSVADPFDHTNRNILQNISSQPGYQVFSQEELRLADYSVGRKDRTWAPAPLPLGHNLFGGFGRGLFGGHQPQHQHLPPAQQIVPLSAQLSGLFGTQPGPPQSQPAIPHPPPQLANPVGASQLAPPSASGLNGTIASAGAQPAQNVSNASAAVHPAAAQPISAFNSGLVAPASTSTGGGLTGSSQGSSIPSAQLPPTVQSGAMPDSVGVFVTPAQVAGSASSSSIFVGPSASIFGGPRTSTGSGIFAASPQVHPNPASQVQPRSTTGIFGQPIQHPPIHSQSSSGSSSSSIFGPVVTSGGGGLFSNLQSASTPASQVQPPTTNGIFGQPIQHPPTHHQSSSSSSSPFGLVGTSGGGSLFSNFQSSSIPALQTQPPPWFGAQNAAPITQSSIFAPLRSPQLSAQPSSGPSIFSNQYQPSPFKKPGDFGYNALISHPKSPGAYIPGIPHCKALGASTEEDISQQNALLHLCILAERILWPSLFNAAIEAYVRGELNLHRPVSYEHVDFIYERTYGGSTLRAYVLESMCTNQGDPMMYVELTRKYDDLMEDILVKLPSLRYSQTEKSKEDLIQSFHMDSGITGEGKGKGKGKEKENGVDISRVFPKRQEDTNL